jgi:hypothetical protein
MGSTKVRENRLRRMAARQGLALQKSRRRDPRAIGYATYRLVDPRRHVTVAHGVDEYGLPHIFGLTLDRVEDFLLGRRDA